MTLTQNLSNKTLDSIEIKEVILSPPDKYLRFKNYKKTPEYARLTQQAKSGKWQELLLDNSVKSYIDHVWEICLINRDNFILAYAIFKNEEDMVTKQKALGLAWKLKSKIHDMQKENPVPLALYLNFAKRNLPEKEFEEVEWDE
jgi:hypothetical protein